MGIVDEKFTFYFRHVMRVRNKTGTTLPVPCYRFSGSGDRPCGVDYTPLLYGLIPFAYPARVDSMLIYWSWSLLDTQDPFVFIDQTPRPTVLSDHSWVEVARYAERTSYVGSDGAGYGVWFFLVPGSGVRVNIGRSIRFDNKLHAVAWSQKMASQIKLGCENTGMASCLQHEDMYFCAAARLKGYDSMVVWHDPAYPGTPHYSGLRSDNVELVLCRKEEPPEQRTACPSMIEFRDENGGACTCNPEAELLSCIESGDSGRVVPAHDYGTRPIIIVSIFVTTYSLLLLPCCVGVRWWWRRRRERRRLHNTKDNTEDNTEDNAQNTTNPGDSTTAPLLPSSLPNFCSLPTSQ